MWEYIKYWLTRQPTDGLVSLIVLSILLIPITICLIITIDWKQVFKRKK